MHYLFNKDGVVSALGLRDASDLGYYLKRAKKFGIEVSKKVGGVELFDIDALMYPSEYKNEAANNEFFKDSHSQLHFKF